jgi:hypothetical protein
MILFRLQPKQKALHPPDLFQKHSKYQIFKSLSPALLRRSGYAKAKGEGFRVRLYGAERGPGVK